VIRRALFAARRAALAAAVGCVLSGAGCAEQSGPREPANFGFVLKDMTGRDVKLADFKGKPLVLNFWATWCGPCQLETPQLEALSRKYRDQGLTILGISTEDAPEAIRRFAAEFKVSYPLLVGVDRTDVQDAFNWTGVLPTSVFIRADGTIAGRLVGPETDAYWDRRIRALF
jgi:cytochrome c biogenesis protein CcmG/thiol:disulfide interchange protein DsbE